MSVYTPVSLAEANALLHHFTLGTVTAIEGITAGVVNSNFRVTTTTGCAILTLIESPEQGRQLPWLVSLLDLLAAAGIPSPRPIRATNGHAIHQLNNKACLLVTLLAGHSPEVPAPHQCRQVGEILGDLHSLAFTTLPVRDNPMGLAKWYFILNQLSPLLTVTDRKLLQEELAFALPFLLHPRLPTGVCHADLFPDNTLFVGDQLTGVIDFHYACHEKWLYDLAITLNAWCFRKDGTLDEPRLHPFWQGYTSRRPLTPMEWDFLDHACRTASLRFALTRLQAQLFPKAGEQVTHKPATEYLTRIHFHRENSLRQQLTH